jgi:hypothetical protein
MKAEIHALWERSLKLVIYLFLGGVEAHLKNYFGLLKLCGFRIK